MSQVVQMHSLLTSRSKELNSPRPPRIAKMWPTVNELLPFGGFPLENTFTVLVADSGVGKSYFAMNFFFYPLYVHDFKIKTLYLSMDMDEVNFGDRFTSFIVQQPYMRTRGIIRDQFELINKAYERHHFDNYFKVDFGTKDIDGIATTLEELANDGFRPELVIIDHLQLVKGGMDEMGMNDICVSLKDMKRQFNTHILGLSQISNQQDLRDKSESMTKVPFASQAKGSGAIRQNANFVFGLAQSFDLVKEGISADRARDVEVWAKQRQDVGGLLKFAPRKMREANPTVPPERRMMHLYYTKWGLVEEVGYEIEDRNGVFLDYKNMAAMDKYKQQFKKEAT